MKVQSVGNCDCQRKKDVSFKAMPGVQKAQRISSDVDIYVDRGIKDFFRNPIKIAAEFASTVANGAIKLLVTTLGKVL